MWRSAARELVCFFQMGVDIVRIALLMPTRQMLAVLMAAFIVLTGVAGCSTAAQPAAVAAAAQPSINARIAPSEYQESFAANVDHILIDVRTPAEFSSGHIPGAINISVETLEQRLSEVSGDVPVVVYCRSGNRSAQAARILANAGYAQIYDLGGIVDWAAQGYPIE